MPLLFNTVSRSVRDFLPRSKRLLISWLQSPSTVILETKKIKSATASTFPPSIYDEVIGPDAMILVRVGEKQKHYSPSAHLTDENTEPSRGVTTCSRRPSDGKQPWDPGVSSPPHSSWPKPSTSLTEMKNNICADFLYKIFSSLHHQSYLPYILFQNTTRFILVSWIMVNPSAQHPKPSGTRFQSIFPIPFSPTHPPPAHLLPPQACSSHQECHVQLCLWRPHLTARAGPAGFWLFPLNHTHTHKER